jgi:hypothetical protein
VGGQVLDFDQVTRNDSVGNVYIDLSPLLTDGGLDQIAGWFPIYDTLKYTRQTAPRPLPPTTTRTLPARA